MSFTSSQFPSSGSSWNKVSYKLTRLRLKPWWSGINPKQGNSFKDSLILLICGRLGASNHQACIRKMEEIAGGDGTSTDHLNGPQVSNVCAGSQVSECSSGQVGFSLRPFQSHYLLQAYIP